MFLFIGDALYPGETEFYHFLVKDKFIIIGMFRKVAASKVAVAGYLGPELRIIVKVFAVVKGSQDILRFLIMAAAK